MKSNDAFSYFFQKVKSKSGMIATQMTFLFVLISALTVSLLLSLDNNQNEQKKSSLETQILMMRDQIKAAIEDSDSWRAIVEHGNNLSVTDCLINYAVPVDCTNSAFPTNLNDPVLANNTSYSFLTNATPQLARVLRTDGTVLISSVAGTGFTDQGRPCFTFSMNPATGDPDCPIGWQVRIQFRCPTGATCRSPTVFYAILLFYHPGPNARPGQVINQNRIRLMGVRGETGPNRNETFEASFGNSSNTVGGGICVPANWTNIPLNSLSDPSVPWNAVLNSGNLLLRAGTYSCSISTSCWQCGTLAVRLRDTSGNRIIATSAATLAGPNILARASLDTVKFTLNSNVTRLTVQHYCQSLPGGGLDQYTMGMPLPDYTDNKFAVVRCSRLH